MTLTTDIVAGQPGHVSAHRTLHRAFNVARSVCDFGAVGDGITDDTAAIQSAINAGGVVRFPPGIYGLSVQPNTDYMLALRDNVRLMGNHRGSCVLRVLDGQPNYASVLCQSDYHQYCDNLTIERLTIDHNKAGNPLQSACELLNAMSRMAIRVYSGRNIQVRECRFTGLEARNTIALNGVIANAEIINNVFDDLNGTTDHHDYSAIYVKCTYPGNGARIAGNWIDAGVPGTPGNVCAIETHGSHILVGQNTVRGFMVGLHVTGAACRDTSEMQLIQGNHIGRCQFGVQLWSLYNQSGGFTTGPGMRGIRITDNHIGVDIPPWLPLSTNYGAGIRTWPANDAPIHTLIMSGNTVYFEPCSDNVQTSKCGAFCALHSDVGDAGWLVSGNVWDSVPGEPIQIAPHVAALSTTGNVQFT